MIASEGGGSAAVDTEADSQVDGELERTTARLRELDHRIKNDLQLIASVLVLQLRRLPDGVERDAIRGALERVNAVSAVHRRLDVLGDPARFDASILIRDLAEEAAAAAHRDDISLRFDITSAVVPARQAAPLALITGELVRNAVRHAFPGRPGEIEVAFGPDGDGLCLSVRDDGDGLEDDARPPAGFGATLVALLAQQLRGSFSVEQADPGLRAIVRFPKSAG